MTILRPALAMLLMMLLIISPSAHAQTPRNAERCALQLRARFNQQQRIYRSALFGRQNAEDMPAGSVRYDAEANAWTKVDGDTWRTQAPGYENTAWSDAQINAQTEWEGMNEEEPDVLLRREKAGIFMAKRRVTSQLIPSLINAFRAFECRLEMVNESALVTFERQPPAGELLRIRTPGCAELLAMPLTECLFSNDPAQQGEGDKMIDPFGIADARTVSEPMLQSLSDREATMLKIAVSYDAAQRSLLQFAGGFDAFVSALRGNFLAPIEQTLPLLSALSRIPCFASQCVNE